MRAAVERHQSPGKDGWGHPLPGTWMPVGTLKCFVWSNASREAVDGDKTAMIEDMRAMFALKADINENDEIAAVTDKAGNAIIDGRLKIDGPVQRKHNHLEAALVRVG
ncbi:hypothetical protein [Devosia sp.]|uniref:hypothetical protein n=1 Tax=Devosia sp. TaxID=1871048 RepID=UPI001AD0737B|nr:hypothetical protein [Devosia sp.]MBN9333864.1 hypothetical protein [Devosia sp.]